MDVIIVAQRRLSRAPIFVDVDKPDEVEPLAICHIRRSGERSGRDNIEDVVVALDPDRRLQYVHESPRGVSREIGGRIYNGRTAARRDGDDRGLNRGGATG